MTEETAQTQSVVIEREVPHPPDKVWRAITDPALIGTWLMKNDFEPVVGRPFTLSADWGNVACRVTEIEPQKSLAYTWEAMGLESVVTWTLTPEGAGTKIRIEQKGFRPEQKQAFAGAQYGWQKFLDNLEELIARL